MPESVPIHVDILLLPFAYMFVLSNRADTAIRAVALDRPILPCTDVVMVMLLTHFPLIMRIILMRWVMMS